MTIPAGQSSVSFTITPQLDALPEAGESLSISILPAGRIGTGFSPSLAFTLTDRPFDGWRAGRFTRAEIHSGLLTSPAAESGQTGQSLVMQYALGDSSVFRVAADASGMSVTRPTGGRANLDYRIETSANLSTWSDRTATFGKTSVPIPGNAGRETLHFQRAAPAPAPNTLFYRLRVDH